MTSRFFEYLKLRKGGYIHRLPMRRLIGKVANDSCGYSFLEGKNSEYCNSYSLAWKESHAEDRPRDEDQHSTRFDLHSSIYRCMASLSAIYRNEPLNIIDVGGGLGSLYYMSKKLCPHLKFKKWIVIEDEKVTEYAHSQIKDETLEFHDDINCIDKEMSIDLIFCSGTLFYISNPYQLFSEILNLNPRCISLARTAMTEKEKDLFGVQKINKNQFVPNYFPQKFKLIEMAKTNYRLQFECLETIGAFRIADEIINMYWLFFKRR
jgi:putative methyltransferase (TIGR04325 family)